jgi:hypothetical protein
MDKTLKRGISTLASAAILGGSLFVGAGAAQAFSCPAGQHVISMGGVSDCVPDASGGGTGGAINYNGGGQPNAPAAPDPVQIPVYNAPTWTPPAYTPPPVYVPRAPAPVTVPNVPAAPQAPVSVGGGYAGGSNYTAPVAGQAPVYTAPGGVAVTKNDQGVWVDPNTGVAADPGVAAQAEQAAAAAPAEAGKTPDAAAQEQAAQAAAQVQQAKVVSVQKAADIAIARVQIEAAVTKALDDALARH